MSVCTKPVYNDVARPSTKLVDGEFNTRVRTLLEGCPCLTPAEEQKIDQLMGMSSEAFDTLCQRQGISLALSEPVPSSDDEFWAKATVRLEAADD
jgi:hypothetical protein